MPSATDLITRALRLLNVIDATETPSAEDLATGKVVLDDFVDDLGTQRASIFAVTRSVYPLSSGVATYTIGVGGTFNQVRPLWIDRVSIRPSRSASPIEEHAINGPMTLQDYQRLTIKATTGKWPTDIYYDYGWTAGLGTIIVYPVPDNSSADLVLYWPTPAVAFADLTTVYTFPPGWSRMYRNNLAKELAADFGVPLPQDVREVAKESLANIKRANWRPTDASLDAAMPGLRGAGRFDLKTGSN